MDRPAPTPAPPGRRAAAPTLSAIPTLNTVRLLLAPALVFVVACLDRGYQTELWQHLARGRLIAREGAIISTDRFTFTVPNRPLRDNNSLSQLLYHALHTLGGLDLLQFVNALISAAAVAWLVHLCRRESRSTRIAAAVGACVFLGLWQTLLIRPQTFSMLLFVALYALLLRVERRHQFKLLALTPPLMALWANVHGGFAVGLVLLAAFVLPTVVGEIRNPKSEIRNKFKGPNGEMTKTGPGACAFRALRFGPSNLFRISDFGFRISAVWPACLVTSALATFLNPYGPSVYRYAGQLSSLGVARGIEEWLPPSPRTLVGASFMLSLAAVATLALRARRHVTARDVCILICFAVPACLSVRMTVWWFLAAAPIAARLAAAPEWLGGRASRRAAATRHCEDHEHPDPSRRRSWRAAVALAAIALACVASLPWLEHYSPLFGAARSAHRTESDLQSLAGALSSPSNDPARVFTRMEWSNYLAWQSDGRVKVFTEGHVELYPPQTWSEYVTVNDARPGWQQVLDRHGVRFLVLDQTYHSALLSEVRRTGAWSPIRHAGPALLFERRTPVAGGAEGPALSELPR